MYKKKNKLYIVSKIDLPTSLFLLIVFLDPLLSLKPKKGSAAFWFNLKPSSLSDDATKHAGCPVLVGQKWVANKWFHDRDNEFRRQCFGNEDVESRFNIQGWLGPIGKFIDLPDW